ncbi:hypothetical protein [Segniliparus rugosus]|uniref:Uncharacterized protein n=1 Tax=Segniliparus rugosus (strain ATCC BAA-974 / DSM 45345 / CCUG 50838 / CIP 108380 / JCM 13579 / CDC 945) TaxID=679197 RepID=E5XKL2_SEGRC|nr:hypothetical protein [Segniliparus rugosus]EFV15124.1 hypothetical protein HMPREF9336_00031 [Segniliparus rugosus ATCC BAA-974]
MTVPRTSSLAPLLSLGLISLVVSGLGPNAAADPQAPYCETLSAALPGIDATYQELKKTADAAAAAADAPAEEEDDEGAPEGSPAKAQQQADLDPDSLLQKEIELADRLAGSLNDLAHQTQEAGLKRIAKEAFDTAGSFAASLREQQDEDTPAPAPRARPNEEAPDPAAAPNVGMLAGLVHQNPTGNAGDDWYANFSYNANKLRNEMNALDHLCQEVDVSQPDGAVAAGNRRAGG